MARGDAELAAVLRRFLTSPGNYVDARAQVVGNIVLTLDGDVTIDDDEAQALEEALRG